MTDLSEFLCIFLDHTFLTDNARSEWDNLAGSAGKCSCTKLRATINGISQLGSLPPAAPPTSVLPLPCCSAAAGVLSHSSERIRCYGVQLHPSPPHTDLPLDNQWIPPIEKPHAASWPSRNSRTRDCQKMFPWKFPAAAPTGESELHHKFQACNLDYRTGGFVRRCVTTMSSSSTTRPVIFRLNLLANL